MRKNLFKQDFSDFWGQMEDKAIPRLRTMLNCYEAWDNGDFNKAHQIANEIKKEGWNRDFPSTVEILGKDNWWFQTDGPNITRIPPDFYDDNNRFRIYVCDELERVDRLINNGNYRSAFLRAAGLNEVILLARLLRFVNISTDRRILFNAFSKKTPTANPLFVSLLWLEWDIDNNNYRKKNDGIVKLGPKSGYNRYDIALDEITSEVTINISQKMSNWWRKTDYFQKRDKQNFDVGWQIFTDIRNQIAHAYFAVSKELAEDARKFIKANIEDFLGLEDEATLHTYKQDHQINTRPLTWGQLCACCDLEEFLPPKLLEERR